MGALNCFLMYNVRSDMFMNAPTPPVAGLSDNLTHFAFASTSFIESRLVAQSLDLELGLRPEEERGEEFILKISPLRR